MINISTKKAISIFFGILFCISLAFNGWLVYQLLAIMHVYEVQQLNVRTLAFTKMFIEDVLMANKEIDFDTRLSLETTVRGLNDQQVFDQWQKFTKATTKEEASAEVKVLLNLLIKKISSNN